MRAWPILLLLGAALAGCASDDPPGALGPAAGPAQVDADGDILHDVVARLIGEPIVMDHDHNDAHLHNGSFNMRQVAYSDLGVKIGDNGFANFVIHEDDAETLAFVAIDGDGTGGFAIVDIADPRNVTVLGTYWMEGSGIQEVRVTPDGNWALLNVQALPNAGTPAGLLDGDGGRDCMVCLHVLDVRDRASPRWVSAMPVELLGTHNMDVEAIGGQVYVFYVGQPLYNPWPDPGNHVYIARLVESPAGPGGAGPAAHLVPVGDFAYNPVDETPGQRPDRIFPHDVLVQDHPSGRKVAYVSAWDGGAVLFDVTDPLRPQMLGREATVAPSTTLSIHWIMQEPAARSDGRVYAWSAPEIGSLATDTGAIRAYDVTDPTRPAQVGAWMLPGNVSIEGRYILSPHTAVPDMEAGLLAVAHYHAGVWILDISDPSHPRHLAYYLPHGPEDAPISGPYWWKKPNFSPDGYGPNVYMARWHDHGDEKLLWVTDRGTGLYALEYTGPVPGSLAP